MKKVPVFNNQYLISKKEITCPVEGWKTISLGEIKLFHSPQLDLFETNNNGVKILLLGFAIHVLHPEWNEKEIVDAFPVEQNDVLDYIDHLCGIHLIIIQKDGITQCYNDAAGVMKMFCLREKEEFIAIASDPKVLETSFTLTKDNSEESQLFYQSDFFLNTGIRLGSQTQFTNVEQVLPNHTISLENSRIMRYFPRQQKDDITTEKALENVQDYFANVISATHRRFTIKCSMTAGWDSRMVLAMTKDYHKDIQYYTFMLPSFSPKHEDVKIPKKMSKALGLNHEFSSKAIQLDEVSLKNLKGSFKLLETENIDTYLGGFAKYAEENNALLVGTVSEICKNYYDNVTINDGASFAKAAHFPVIPYTISYFEKKLTELEKLQEKFNYDLRDIAHWEQDITNFAAKRTLYLFSFVRAFSPFNARVILKTILSVPREMRDKQQHEFYRLYLEKFYPELLKFPVNPSLKQQLIRLGKKVGIYSTYKKLSTQLRK